MMRKVLLVLLVLLIAGSSQTVFCADDVPRMTKEELKGQIGNPDFVIVDVRTAYEWQTTNSKIKGAVREEAMKLGSWINKYPKDKTIVFY
jgi:hypothetical protein